MVKFFQPCYVVDSNASHKLRMEYGGKELNKLDRLYAAGIFLIFVWRVVTVELVF